MTMVFGFLVTFIPNDIAQQTDPQMLHYLSNSFLISNFLYEKLIPNTEKNKMTYQYIDNFGFTSLINDMIINDEFLEANGFIYK